MCLYPSPPLRILDAKKQNYLLSADSVYFNNEEKETGKGKASIVNRSLQKRVSSRYRQLRFGECGNELLMYFKYTSMIVE